MYMFTYLYYFPTEKSLINYTSINALFLERQYRYSMYKEFKVPMKYQIKFNVELILQLPMLLLYLLFTVLLINSYSHQILQTSCAKSKKQDQTSDSRSHISRDRLTCTNRCEANDAAVV